MSPKGVGMNKKSFLKLLKSHNQDHIIDHFNALAPDKQYTLVKNNADLDLELVFQLHREYCATKGAVTLTGEIKPARVIPLPKTPDEKKYQNDAKLIGESLISREKMAVLIVAGGQGVRLGHNKPKGTFPISPVMNKTLFHLFSEQVVALSARYNARIPLLIMTSQENHDETMNFFDKFNFFGLDKKNVYFFQQGMMPTITPEGQLLLKDETNLFVNPDGHGGSLMALYKSGHLDSLIHHGFSELFYCQVDNPLLRIADPVFLGYHSLAQAECSTKVVRRKKIEEKVGVYVSLNGRDTILEYSDFGGRHMSALDNDGSILHWAGNTAIHLLNLNFIKNINENGFALPYHCANKEVEVVRPDGSVKPLEVWKFESFVFDAIPLAKRTCCMEVDRAEEFSPVKNKSGSDSPLTARESLSNLHKSWLREAEVNIPHQLSVEVSPLFALDKEELVRKLKGTIHSITKDTYFG
jgi:UDP-N-acetylglucosamine/UDP-N-acetylgalactosamine diphosphorylase